MIKNEVTVLCFYAKWAMDGCKSLETLIKESFPEYNLCWYDVDDINSPNDLYGIRNIPAIIIKVGDIEMDRIIGPIGNNQLKARLEKFYE